MTSRQCDHCGWWRRVVEIIYENEAWLPFFVEALDEIGVKHRLNFIEETELDLNQPPDNVIFLNRVSPSAPSRGHRLSHIRAEQYLEYLAAYHRVVVNDKRTIDYELSKVAQYQLLKRHGLSYPNTVFGSDVADLARAAGRLIFPVVTKHNCSGKGIGIHKFDTMAALSEYLHSEEFEPSPDGIMLVQEYIEPRHERITRVELVDGELVYALHSSTAAGFDLCPADACGPDASGQSGAVCDINGVFEYVEGFEHPLVEKYIDLAKNAGFDMVGIEFMESLNGTVYTYDINGTTNYSPDVEAQSGHKARRAFQEMIRRRLG